jgi:hypothetical protein
MRDHKSYYAVLGADLAASTADIHARYRALAKRLHPDNPATGNAAAFMRVKEAYEVLSSPLRRAEYDRAGRLAEAEPLRPARSAPPPPRRPPQTPPPRSALDDFIAGQAVSRPAGRRLPAWMLFPRQMSLTSIAAVVLGFTILGSVTALVVPLLRQPRTAENVAVTDHFGADMPRGVPADDPGPPNTTVAGEPDYVQPVAGTAILWRYDQEDRHFRPAGTLAPFTPVLVTRLVSNGGLAEVRLPDGQYGFIYPHILVPGDAAAAQRADCVYNAGPSPHNAELLSGLRPDATPPTTTTRITVLNPGDVPAVFALAGAGESVAVYVSAHGRVVMDHVPVRAWRVQAATGDLWSRPCFRFTAGMRARRLPQGPLADTYTLPLTEGADIADEAFAH